MGRHARLRKLGAAPIDGGGNAQTVAIFGDGAPRDVDVGGLEPRHDGVVGQDAVRRFLVDHLLDLESAPPRPNGRRRRWSRRSRPRRNI